MTPDFVRKYHIYKLLNGTTLNSCITREYIIKSLATYYYDYHTDDKLYEGLLVTSEKTIRRDIRDIEIFFGVEIGYKRKNGHYMINYNILSNGHRGIFDKMELFLASHKEQQWSPYITTEQSSLNTSINILGLVKAIEEKVYIIIAYKGWYDDDRFTEIKEAKVQPLHIKEYNRGWYLLVYNKNIGTKVLCLDERIVNLVITKEPNENPIDFCEKGYFKDVFGVLKDDVKAERIILKVANHHFKYIQTKKLHHSQEIMAYPVNMETNDLDYTDMAIFGEISLFLKPNYEFLIELFKFNLWIKVIEPIWLAEKIVAQHRFISEEYYLDIQG